MKVVNTPPRKGIDLDNDTKKALTSMGLDNNQPLKTFIESQLAAMGAKGIPYTDLWKQCEAVTNQLKELSK
jgi:hypothetical protein